MDGPASSPGHTRTSTNHVTPPAASPFRPNGEGTCRPPAPRSRCRRSPLGKPTACRLPAPDCPCLATAREAGTRGKCANYSGAPRWHLIRIQLAWLARAPSEGDLIQPPPSFRPPRRRDIYFSLPIPLACSIKQLSSSSVQQPLQRFSLSPPTRGGAADSERDREDGSLAAPGEAAAGGQGGGRGRRRRRRWSRGVAVP